MNYIGDFALGGTVYIPLTTATGAGGAVAPSSAFEVEDFAIYKNGSATQKSTTNGITISSPFDGIVGGHYLVIDTSNATGDAGFWSDAGEYSVWAVPDETVDGETVVAVVATFSIGRPLAASRLAAIGGAPWDAQYSQHTTAGTFGKLFDIWRKSNPAIDGVVTSAITPTTTTFSTNITGYPSGAFVHSVLLFVNGSTNAESNSPIIGYVSTDGVITLEEPMQQAVQVGDEFVIAANSHVHAIADIAGGVWSALTASYSAATGTFGYLLYSISTMIENVSGSRWTAKAMEETPIAVNVLPATGITAERSSGVVLSPFVGETISQSITIYQNDGITPIDLSTKSLEIVFEARSGTDVIVIPDGDITISGDDDNVVTFAYPSAVTVAERLLRFSLRDDAAPRTVYLSGLCRVTIAPKADP